MVSPDPSRENPTRLFRAFAEAEINLPYLTCVRNDASWGIHFIVDQKDRDRACGLLNESFAGAGAHAVACVILSLFPHRSNPEIVGSLFEALGREGVTPDALAHSPSAISIVLNDKDLNRASSALFGPFTFGAYRTPEDWKLAQKGKEQLYKEVVASYQEQRPKVYGLECREGQALIELPLGDRSMTRFGDPFKAFARMGFVLNFMTTCPCPEETSDKLVFCLPVPTDAAPARIFETECPGMEPHTRTDVAVFHMNGPHFGDRYGVASELFSAFEAHDIELLGLSCSIASISGVLPAEQIQRAVQAIQACFEVPSVTHKP
jgi:aspartokinase